MRDKGSEMAILTAEKRSHRDDVVLEVVLEEFIRLSIQDEKVMSLLG